jgi:hypothetical protein
MCFHTFLHRSCTDVVREIVDQRKQEGYPHPDEEQLELKRMGEEAEEWIKLGGLLLDDLATVPPQDKKEGIQPKTASTVEKKGSAKAEGEKSSEGSEQGEATGEELPEKLPDEMNVIGVDDNIHSKSLQQAIEEVPNLQF